MEHAPKILQDLRKVRQICLGGLVMTAGEYDGHAKNFSIFTCGTVFDDPALRYYEAPHPNGLRRKPFRPQRFAVCGMDCRVDVVIYGPGASTGIRRQFHETC